LQLLLWASGPALDDGDDVVDHRLLPGVQHFFEERRTAGVVPVEASLGDSERVREHLDADRVGSTGRQRVQPGVDPGAARSTDFGHDHIYTAPY